MPHARRVSPRIPYDEAICLARSDGDGRLYGRGVDLSASGLCIVCAESCPIGTAVACKLLLPHGPHTVTGRVVRVTAAAGGFGLAITFNELKPGTQAAIANMVDEVAAATLRKATDAPPAAEVISRPAGDLAADAAQHARTKRYGSGAMIAAPVDQPTGQPLVDEPPVRPPPNDLPPPCGQPLPSVVLAPGLLRDVKDHRPSRQRLRPTAAVARPRGFGEMRWSSAMASASHGAGATALTTERLTILDAQVRWPRALWALAPLVALLAVALARL